MTDEVRNTTQARDMLRLTPAGCCYLCQRPVGVFTWTDQNGKAHPWCVESERPKWEAAYAK